jgi:LysM repeat protein
MQTQAMPAIKAIHSPGIVKTKIDKVEIITVDEANKPSVKPNVDKPILTPDIQSAPLTHTIEKGDSFWKIARAYGVSKNELAACNNMSVNQPLKVGSVLVIPPGGVQGYKAPPIKKRSVVKKSHKKVYKSKKTSYTPRKRVATPKVSYTSKKAYTPKSVSGSNSGTYTVRSGDSLWKIAKRYGVTSSKLAAANGINPSKTLKIGTQLVIPGKSINKKTYTQKSSTVAKSKSTSENSYSKPVKNYNKPVVSKSKTKIRKTTELDKLLNDAEESVNSDTVSKSDDILSNDTELNSLLEEDTDDLIDETLESAPDNLPKGDYYTEQILPDETIEEIAERNGFTVEEILKANPQIKPGEKIKSFSTIRIPKQKIK